MKCPNKIIATAMGILLYNCDKSNNTFSGLNLSTDSLTTINNKIADGTLVYLPFQKAAGAISANNTDSTTVTDGYRQMVVDEAKSGINAMLDCVFADALIKATMASGGQLGYVVTKEGYLIGKAYGNLFDMIKLEVSMPSPFPNGNFANSSNLPNVQVQINFGTTNEVADWRMRKITGLSSPDDLLELEVCDVKFPTTTTMQLVDLMGNDITTGVNDDSDATYIYSDGTARTTTITAGVVTFSAALTVGSIVTIEGSISGYIIPKPLKVTIAI